MKTKTDKKTTKTTKASTTTPRIERWRQVARKMLAETEYEQHAMLIGICAEMEGMNPIEMLVSQLSKKRGGAKVVESCPKRLYGPAYDAWVDTEAERNPRTCATHDRDVMLRLIGRYAPFSCAETHAAYSRPVLLKWYHKGDIGVYAAFWRMIEDAMKRCADQSSK